MATKKTTTRKKSGKKDTTSPEEGTLQLTELEMKELALFEARNGMQTQVLENLRQRDQLLTIDYKQKQQEIRAQILRTKASMQEIAQAHNTFVVQLETRLGIKLADYTYDDSGTLTFNPIDEEGTAE